MRADGTWHDALERARRAGEAAVLVTVVRLEGSAPRGVGSRMFVSAGDFADTIGGGALERAALEHARALLARGSTEPVVEHRAWSLGKALSQCCGGRATLAFELFPASDFRLEVFGAGHVARELARVLRRLPCIATFHDPRRGWLARLGADAPAGGVPDIELDVAPAAGEGPGILRTSALGENVYGAVERCRPGSLYLVMSHSHELDFEVCEAVLSRGDATYLGLIASGGKARAFRKRLAKKGFTEEELAGLTAPLGSATGVRTGNLPMEVAVAAVADVLTAREAVRAAAESRSGGGVRAEAAAGSHARDILDDPSAHAANESPSESTGAR